MILFLSMNLMVAAGAVLFTLKVLRLPGLADALIAAFLFYLGQIIFSQTLLGAASRLYLPNLLLFNGALLIAVMLFTRKKTALIPAGLNPAPARELLGNKLLLFMLCALGAFVSLKVLVNLLNPPFGWDSLNYHFTFAVEWLKNHNLSMPITVSDDPSPPYYPINGSLYFLWLIFPFRSVFLADLGQLPFFFLALISVFAIARKLGLERKVSFYCAFLFFLVPNFFKQLQIAYVDVMVAALFLACLNFLLVLKENFNWRGCLAFGVAWGLLLGTKTVALPYSLLLLPPFAYLLLKNFKRIYLAVPVLAGLVILGGFSYLRNYLETGNPLYPMDMVLSGRHIFKGVMDNLVYRAHFNAQDYALGKLLFHEGLGVQSLFFILPGIFLVVPVYMLKKRRLPDFFAFYLFILPLLMYLEYRYIIPLANVRYLYSLLGLGMVLGFYLFKLLRLPGKLIAALVLISVLASISELAKRQELVFSMALTFIFTVFAFTLLGRIKQGVRMMIRNPAFIVFLTVLLLVFLGAAERYYRKHEFSRYAKMTKYSGFWPDATQAWEWLNEHTNADNIAYIGRPVPFPLYGSGFKNNVYYVSVNQIEPARLHYFKNSRYNWGYDFLSLHRNLEEEGNYRGGAQYSLWLENLKKRRISYLFVYSLHQIDGIEFPREDAWAAAHPEKFTGVFHNQTVHIYRVNR
ncbi:MAG: hypothetical protein PHD09_01475 [Candidatus Omnitrophica bacterium]|nr:hypothetical protein [Candidatus Omnitrophota bacterium]